MKNWTLDSKLFQSACGGGAEKCVSAGWAFARRGLVLAGWILAIAAATAEAQSAATALEPSKNAPQPPRVTEALRFLAQRGWTAAHGLTAKRAAHPDTGAPTIAVQTLSGTPATATWEPVGPMAVQTPGFGLVTGRISAVALDPSDATGNRLYLGTTGGGVWVAQNAGISNPFNVSFSPLTDTLAALGGVTDASISIGALTVQLGGTGVILAGTGDPNDVLDSYYGGGILRSVDGGNTWTLTSRTPDAEQGLGAQDFSFLGEGFAGFAWSTVNPQLVVAAVAHAYEGALVNAESPGKSSAGLYYSSDSGATWHLATITDGGGNFVQGPLAAFAAPDGNAATSVVWNPVRQLFMAAVRNHGYYQSTDGRTWARMAVQPGAGLTTALCPNNPGSTGSIACPILRGTLAVNPVSGDTFAWTVDGSNQDKGLWQDQCGVSGGVCSSQTISFGRQWSTAALETNTALGGATIVNGGYTLALVAVPSGQDTLLLAGANDLWKCSLAMGCVWRNTTNAATCMSAQVGAYQHALAWNTANPLEIFVGNDSGLWRSTDAIGETGQSCSATDSSHFQNLNGGLGSLAEVVSLSNVTNTPYTMMAGLGVNGTAGVKSTTATADWPQILGGYGGPVAIDPKDSSNWYVNNQAGVSIYRCAQAAECTAAAFGSSPVMTNAQVGGDGSVMPSPAPFLVDPLDTTQLLIGTCRVWRGPANGVGWTGGNAISPILDASAASGACKGDALIRSVAAMPVSGGGEVVYVGMYGSADGGANLPGHVLRATVNPAASGLPAWQDLAAGPVGNDINGLNAFGMDISSLFIDSHDPTGNTVYVTVEGAESPSVEVQVVYRSIDGGKHWTDLTANLPATPASSVLVDPQDANTVYVATDEGVYFTSKVGSCAVAQSNCWSAFGTGLPEAPVVALSASPAGAASSVLVAATYGRGVWQTGLWTAGTGLTTATASPATVTFADQKFGTASSAQSVTLQNTGNLALTPTAISVSGDFSETDNCRSASVATGANCTIQVTFTPTATGARTGQMLVSANVYGGQLVIDLSGTGTPAGTVSLTPASIGFGQVEVGTSSTPQQVQAGNSGALALSVSSITATSPFTISSNSCGTTTLAANSSCQVQVEFAPTQTGAVAGTLTFTDGAGIQTVALSGTGAAAPTDALNPASLSFSATPLGQQSAAQAITLTNIGDLPLNSIAVSASTGFQTSNNCGTQLTGHAVCSISVVFAPTQTGSQTGTLTVSDLLRTQTVALSGTGIAPAAFSVAPASLNFGTQLAGVASAPQTLAVSNTGGVPMANVGFQITGSAAGSFATGTTNCGATLNNGSSCIVQVIFTPAATGGSAATLMVYSSTVGVTPVAVPLAGTGQVLSGLGVSPAQLTFTAIAPGLSRSAQTVTVTNTTSFTALSLALAATAPFSLTQNTCTGSLVAGAQCTVGVIFSPISGGAATGILNISSPSVATPASVALSGTGAVPAAIQVSPASISFGTTGVGVASSQTAVTVTNQGTVDSLTNLALTASAGFQLVSNTCPATLAAQATCTVGVEFSPAGAGALTGSLTVASSAVSAGKVVALSGMGFDFTPAISGASSQTVASGQTAYYTLTINTLSGTQGTFTYAYSCGTLPANALCVFNPATTTAIAGTSGSVTVEILTGKSSSAFLTGGSDKWGMLPLVAGLLLPLALLRRLKEWRKRLLLLALMAVAAGVISSCTSAGLVSSGSGSGGSSKTTATPAGTYTIPITVISSGVSHAVPVTLVVD